jgi:nicotinamide-nucleotide amidase
MVRLRITGTGDHEEKLAKELDEQFSALKLLVKEWLVIDQDKSLQAAINEMLAAKNKTMATAESCTGGYIAHLITMIPGASNSYKGSVISYDNEVKTGILHVSPDTLQKVGAVSEEVVKEMVAGAIRALKVDFAVATSGIMGPGGGSPEKPVGTVWIAVGNNREVIAQKFNFRFDRERNIEITTANALNLLRKFIASNS